MTRAAQVMRRVLVIDRDEASAAATGEALLRDNDVTVLTNVDDARDVLTTSGPFDLILCALDVGAAAVLDLVAQIDPAAAERIVFVASAVRGSVYLRCVPTHDVRAVVRSMERGRSTVVQDKGAAREKTVS